MTSPRHKDTLMHSAHQRQQQQQHQRDGDLYSTAAWQYAAAAAMYIKGIGRHINRYLFATLTMVSFIFSFFFRFSPPTSAFHSFISLSHSRQLAFSVICMPLAFIQCFTLLYFKAKRIQTMACCLCTHKIKQIIYNCMIFLLYTAHRHTHTTKQFSIHLLC